jgi:tetratricopeptide (TPR) repeat protein
MKKIRGGFKLKIPFKLPSRKKTSEDFCREGYAYINLFRYDEAANSFKKALEIEPNNIEALKGRGLSLHMLKKYSEALEIFNKALEIDPDNDVLLYNRGSALCELGRYEEALKDLERALEIRENAGPWFGKAAILFNMKRYEEALECIEKALQLDPHYVHAKELQDQILKKLE